MNTQLTAGSLFLEGLLSFFTPCVLPLIPLYFAYLFQGAQKTDADGNITYDRGRTFLLTVGFVLGICTVFAAAGLSTSGLRTFFTTHKVLFELIGGIFLIFLGLITLGVIRIPLLLRLNVSNQIQGTMTFARAYLLGGAVSFAWTPCVGPMLAQAILRASQAETAAQGWLYLGSYTLGFVSIFLIAGLFTSEILNLLKKIRGITKYTGILSGIIVVGMGCWLLYQGYGDYSLLQNQAAVTEEAEEEQTEEETEEEIATTDQFDFELQDNEGNTVSLKDFRGQAVILDFYETWCMYCNQSLGTLKKADEMENVQVLMVVTPSVGSEGDLEYIEDFLKEKGYSFRLLIDDTAKITGMYGISGYPTTFFIQPDGVYYGYLPGYAPEDEFLQIVSDCLGEENN